MATLGDLKVRLSGGVGNTDPDAALGDAMSTAAGGLVDSQTGTGLTTISGVVIDDAMGQAIGDGSLFYDDSLTTLRWTPPGGTAGTAVDVGSDGVYAIQGGNDGGVLVVTVTAASLPSSDQTNTVTIANIANNVFDDVSKADSQAGDTEYRGLYWENAHASDSMVDGRWWIENNTPGQDVINVADGGEAVDADLEIIANENTAPVGEDFDVSHIDFASGIVMPTPFLFSEFKGFWIRRTVPSGVTAAELANTFRLGVRIFV